MSRRLIGFIVVFAIFLLFVIFNLENKCDINFGFGTVKDVPVFVTVFVSFLAGMICILPFIFKRKGNDTSGDKPEKKSDKKGKIAGRDDTADSDKGGFSGGSQYDSSHYGID